MEQSCLCRGLYQTGVQWLQCNNRGGVFADRMATEERPMEFIVCVETRLTGKMSRPITRRIRQDMASLEVVLLRLSSDAGMTTEGVAER